MDIRTGRKSALLACFAVSAFVAMTAEGSVALGLPPALVERGWEEITFEGKTPNRYRVCGDDCIAIETQSSVSMIGKPVAVNLDQQSRLQWAWRIEAPPVDTDLSRKGGDDRAVAVYVGFAFDPDNSSLSELLLRPLVELIRGEDAPGRGISYVWAGDIEAGATFRNPYQKSAAAIIVSRTAADPVGEWVMESRNVAADYRRVFGDDPTAVTHLLISADSDDTGVANRASVRSLMFRGG